MPDDKAGKKRQNTGAFLLGRIKYVKFLAGQTIVRNPDARRVTLEVEKINTIKFCGSNMSTEMKNLVEKARTEFTNVEISVESGSEIQDAATNERYSAVANGTKVSADSTHLLFERIKNIIGEAEVATDKA